MGMHVLLRSSCIASVGLAQAGWMIFSPRVVLAGEAELIAQQENQAVSALYDLSANQSIGVGTAYRWAATSSEQSTLTWGEGDDAEVEFDQYTECGILASVLVTDVDADNQIRRIRIVVSRLYLFEDELLPEGTEVVAERAADSEVTYSIDGEVVDDESVLFVLDQFVDVGPDDGKTDEDLKMMMNVPDEPQPVGAQWEVNASRLFEELLGPGFDVDEAEVAGTVHFVRAFELFAVPAIEIFIRIKLEGALDFFGQQEPAWELLANEFTLDSTLQVPRQDGDVNDHIQMTRRNIQRWRDPEVNRVGLYEVTITRSKARRTLTPREREFLGFRVVPPLN